jgi:ornithine cyclodeaminase/alanine dehydrogenase
VTQKRTAALSVVAAKRLANANSASAAFIGCGIQARGHLEALSEHYPLQEIRAFGRGTVNRDSLCQLARTRGLSAVPCDTAKAAINGADIVVTTLTLVPEPKPFLDARWLKPGSFTTMTDLALPWLPETMSSFDRIVIDDLEQETKMSKPMVKAELVAGDLTGLVCGEVPGRQDFSERTTFVFRGLAVGDLAVAGHAYMRAKSIGALT